MGIDNNELTHLFPMHPFFTPLKASENLTVFCFQRVEERYIGNKWVKVIWSQEFVLIAECCAQQKVKKHIFSIISIIRTWYVYHICHICWLTEVTCYLRQATNFGKGVINGSWNFQVQKAQVTLQMGTFITFAVTFTWIRLKLMIHSLSTLLWSKASTTCLLPTRLLKCIVRWFSSGFMICKRSQTLDAMHDTFSTMLV